MSDDIIKAFLVVLVAINAHFIPSGKVEVTTTTTSQTTTPRRATTLNWAALRQCENGGKYTSTPTDYYRGAYQFDYSTWESVGGSGDPAEASEQEQDMRAQRLYDERGASPWPVCGSRLFS